LEIAILLQSSDPFRIYSACHEVSWLSTDADRQALYAMIKPGRYDTTREWAGDTERP